MLKSENHKKAKPRPISLMEHSKEKNFKITLKDIKQSGYTMFMDGKTEYCKDDSSSQINVYIQSNSYQNPKKISHDI